MVMHAQSESGISRAALATALLFLLTTVTVAIWGGMQYRALRASDAQREALEQRLDALRQETSRTQPTDAPAVPMAPPIAVQPPAPVTLPSSSQPPPPPPPDFGNQAEMRDEPVVHAGTRTKYYLSQEEYNLFIDKYYGSLFAEMTPEKNSRAQPLIFVYIEEMLDKFQNKELGINYNDDARTELELHDQLSGILSAREMALYYECQHTMAKEAILEELGSFGRGHIDTETGTFAKNIMAEEIIAAKARALKLPSRHIGPMNVITVEPEVRSDAMRKARIQLGRMLSSDGLRDFDRYVEEQRASFSPRNAE